MSQTAQDTPAQRAAAAIIDGPGIMDVLVGVTASRGLIGRPDPAERQKAIDYLAEIIGREYEAQSV